MSKGHHSLVAGDHFEVAPSVSGLPLASHSRRALAMLVDLAIIAAPSIAIRNPIAPIAVLLAAVLYRYSSSWSGLYWQSHAGLASRRAISFALIALGLVAGQIWHSGNRKHQRLSHASLADTQMALAKLDTAMSTLDGVEGVSPELRKNLKTLRQVVADAQPTAATGGAGSDTGEPEEIRRLRSENFALAQQVKSMEQDLKEARKEHGILNFLKVTAHDFGIGLGWSGLYFIIFPVLWNGRTPGKRLMQIRVARLNGKPISWWNAFERFHGYVSCLVGGLIGFLQVFWDHQSQGHHDKIAETVVVRDVPILTAIPVGHAEASQGS